MDNEVLKQIKPEEIFEYLESKGWKKIKNSSSLGYSNKWEIYYKEKDYVEIPLKVNAIDYGKCVSYVIEDLARIENRSQIYIYKNIKKLVQIVF